jgi:hypothetical protein
VNRKLLLLAGAAGAIAAAATSCGASGDNKIHGVDSGDAKAVAGAYVLDELVCSSESLNRQYDYLATPPKDRKTYVLERQAACKPAGAARLQQSVVSENGKSRVVEVRYVTGKGSGRVRITVRNAGDGYRVVQGAMFHTTLSFAPAS